MENKLKKFDKTNQGRLDIANFKTCLFKLKLGLSFDDINRISRYIEKDKNFMIDYVAFIQRLKNTAQTPDSLFLFTMDTLLSEIKSFLSQYKVAIKDFFKVLYEKKPQNLKINDFSMKKLNTTSFARLFFPHITEKKPDFSHFIELIHKIDLDQDGYLDCFDIETFMKRFEYLPRENSPTKKNETTSTNLQTSSYVNPPALFPKVPLTEEKFDEVVAVFKKAINDRKLTFFEAFQTLDKNEDGFLTIDEFLEGMDKFVKLSRTIKEGLFVYFDSLRIGMVDYPQFLAGLSKLPNIKKVKLLFLKKLFLNFYRFCHNFKKIP